MAAKKEDSGAAEVQKNMDKINEKGYFGAKVDPRPNSAYSLESGPDAPPIHDGPRQVDAADAGKED